MTAELEGYQDQLLSIQQDTSGIVANPSDDQFNWRPAANRLNWTSEGLAKRRCRAAKTACRGVWDDFRNWCARVAA